MTGTEPATERRTTMTITPRVRAALALVASAALLAGCGGAGSTGQSDAKGQTINLVGFAVPEAANKAIAAEFNKTLEGKNVTFKTSYGASGDQSRAV
jgi:sulfate transport system substrate-binding protein